MCLHDVYCLRLTNTSKSGSINNPLNLSANKASVTIPISDELRKKGKCQIKVIEATGGLQNGNDASTRVIPANTHIMALGWDLPVLGYDNEVIGTPQIFGSSTNDITNAKAFSLDGVDSNTFTCLSLPQNITITRYYYDTAGAIQIADEYTTAVVPLQVTLNIQFFEDDKKD